MTVRVKFINEKDEMQGELIKENELGVKLMVELRDPSGGRYQRVEFTIPWTSIIYMRSLYESEENK